MPDRPERGRWLAAGVALALVFGVAWVLAPQGELAGGIAAGPGPFDPPSGRRQRAAADSGGRSTLDDPGAASVGPRRGGPAGAFAVRVVAADTGRPVERFAARVAPADDPERALVAAPPAARHRGGELELTGLRDGRTFLSVVAADPMLAPSPLVSFEPGVDQEPLTVALARLAPIRVRVVTAGSARPVAGATVAVVALPLQGRARRIRPIGEVPLHPLIWRSSPQLWAEARTDEAGCATLGVPAGSDLVEIVALGHGDSVRVRGPFVRGQALTIESPDWGRLSGRLIAAFPPSWRVELTLTRTRRPRRPVLLSGEVPTEVTAALDAGGRFSVEDLAPGTWRLRLRVRAEDVDERCELTAVTIAPGEVEEVELDARRWTPGRIRGRISAAGALGGSIRVCKETGGTVASAVPVGADGRFTTPLLLPGRYLLGWEAEARAQAIWRDRGPVQVRAGATVAGDFVVVERSVRLRLWLPGGEPARGMPVMLWGEALPRTTRRTDDGGYVTLDHAPQGEIHGRSAVSAPELPIRFQVPAGGGRYDVEHVIVPDEEKLARWRSGGLIPGRLTPR